MRHLCLQLGLRGSGAPAPLLSGSSGALGWATGAAKRARHASMQEARAREATLHKEIECYFAAGKENPAGLRAREHGDAIAE